jgi:hypothetical protein
MKDPFPTSGLTRLDFCRESSKLTEISILKKSKKKSCVIVHSIQIYSDYEVCKSV